MSQQLKKIIISPLDKRRPFFVLRQGLNQFPTHSSNGKMFEIITDQKVQCMRHISKCIFHILVVSAILPPTVGLAEALRRLCLALVLPTLEVAFLTVTPRQYREGLQW